MPDPTDQISTDQISTDQISTDQISTDRITIGVDTHKDVHVAVAVNQHGVRREQLRIPATTSGYVDLQRWAATLGTVQAFGIEGTGSYGAALTRFLLAAGHRVVEVNRPDRATRHRAGKSDPIDAETAARAVLARVATGTPKTGTGQVEMIRMLKMAKDSAVKASTQAINQIKALLITAPAALREHLSGLTTSTLLDRCAALRPGTLTTPTAATKHTLRLLARRTHTLRAEAHTLNEHIHHLLTTTAPELLTVFGAGPDTAATLLITAGDNPQRLHTEAAFAALCGTNPIPASSGKTTRHRLNRGGNRQANAALHRIIIVRLRWHQPTRDYLTRRLTQGKTKPEIIRCLKRHLTREIHAALRPHPPLDHL